MSHDPFFEISVDMLGEFSADGTALRLSPSWTTHLGWSQAELQSASPLLISKVHPDDIASTRQALSDLFTLDKKLAHFINRYRHKDGSYRWVSWSCVAATADQKFYIIARDVTEFRHERRHLQSLVQSLDDLVLEVDEHFQVVHSWENKNSPIGFSAAEIKTPVIEFAIRTVLKENKSQIVHFQDVRNPRKYWAAKITPIACEPEETKKVSILIRDTTQKKISEDEKSKADLALIHASKMASLGEMAGGVAHEINNPLSVILARAQQVKRKILENVTDPQTWIDDIGKIEGTALRILRIVKGLKAFSRSGEKDPFTQFSLFQMIDETLELCRAKFHSQAVELRIKVDPHLKIEARSIQLSQVLLNLLNNSYDAVVGTFDPWVEISATVVGQKLRLTITDSGHGISGSVVDKLMQPFFTTKEVGKGTGLGLSISKGIIEDHHGELQYNSQSEHTQFVIEIPLQQLSKAA